MEFTVSSTSTVMFIAPGVDPLVTTRPMCSRSRRSSIVRCTCKSADEGSIASSRTTQELWQTLDDGGIDPALRKAMAKPANTDSLFDYAVDRLLASVLECM